MATPVAWPSCPPRGCVGHRHEPPRSRHVERLREKRGEDRALALEDRALLGVVGRRERLFVRLDVLAQDRLRVLVAAGPAGARRLGVISHGDLQDLLGDDVADFIAWNIFAPRSRRATWADSRPPACSGQVVPDAALDVR
jgi:hypothetical protein